MTSEFISNGMVLRDAAPYVSLMIRKQVVDFDFKRQFRNPPVLPSLPILSSFFAGQKSWYPCHAQMHLQSEGSSGDKRMYVSKIAVKEKPQPPVINFV
jgi:hypothetical protein